MHRPTHAWHLALARLRKREPKRDSPEERARKREQGQGSDSPEAITGREGGGKLLPFRVRARVATSVNGRGEERGQREERGEGDWPVGGYGCGVPREGRAMFGRLSCVQDPSTPTGWAGGERRGRRGEGGTWYSRRCGRAWIQLRSSGHSCASRADVAGVCFLRKNWWGARKGQWVGTVWVGARPI